MDALEDAGIIGPPTGTSKAREVFQEGGQPSEQSEQSSDRSEAGDTIDKSK
jgi:hypothetical protein